MNTLLGLLFTLLWASAAIAIKFGLHSTTPLVLVTLRLLGAGLLMFLYVHVFSRRYRWPSAREWPPLAVLGVTNTTLYLGGVFWALRDVSAGLVNLFMTVNPFMVLLLSWLWLKRKVSAKESAGMLIAAAGLLTAVWPSLAQNQATPHGLAALGVGMLAMAVGSVYFKSVNLPLPGLVINTWQLVLGGAVLLPVTYFVERRDMFFVWDANLIISLLWLILGLSIGAMLLWFYLLKLDAVRASNWLFMTPVFGYILSAVLLREPVTGFDMAATVLVIAGLYLSGNLKVERSVKAEMRPAKTRG